MSTRYFAIRLVAGVLIAIALGCGGGGGGGSGLPTTGTTTSVEFGYLAATAIDEAVRAAYPQCVSRVGRTHIHPSWRSFGRVNLIAMGAGEWRIVFDDVPVGIENRIRISDSNACDTDPNGASTENVLANGTLLTRVVETPGEGPEPGLAFRVAADGVVTP